MKKARTRSRKGAPGIIDVGIRAGVSAATVSRFFNNPEMVRKPTRKRIERAAQDLGYIRDRMAGALHNRFSGTFGLIVPTIDNAIFAEMIEAFSARLQEEDRTLLIAAHGYDLGLEAAIVRSLLERRIDGIALVGFDHDQVSLNMLRQRDVPVVCMWNYDVNAIMPSVGADNEYAGELIADHIVKLKHQDIALIFPETSNNDRARGRKNGVLVTLQSAGVSIAKHRDLQCSYDLGEAKKLALSMFGQGPPDAIICGNDIIAHGVLFACHSLGIRVPSDVSVVGIGDFGGSEYLEPGLTTVRLPAKRIGRQSADTLLSMSETGLPPVPFHQPVPVELKVRDSTQISWR